MQKQGVISTAVLEGKLLDVGGVGNGPTEGKLAVVFHTLDTVVVQSGVYKQLLKLCRDELYDAVYSKDLTAAESDDHCCVRRIPYFILSQRLRTHQDGKNDQLLQQLDELNSQLLTSQQNYELAQKSISELERTKQDLLSTIDTLNNKLDTEYDRNQSLENDMNGLKKKMDEKCHLLNCDITRLQRELCDKSETVEQLTPYKTSYHQLQTALNQLSGSQQTNAHKQDRNGRVTPQNALLTSDVENCRILEQQILTAQNAIIEEYDKYLEELKQLEFVFPVPGYQHPSCDIEVIEEEDSVEKAMIKEHFRTNLDGIDKELALLRQHKLLLETHLLEVDNGLSSNRLENGSEVGTQQGTVNFELSLNPFTPHERFFNKYAVMLYTSDNNSKTFTEFSQAAYCPSCAEQTVICPHKLLSQEHVFKLPDSVTHLKVARPRLRTATSRNVPPSSDGRLTTTAETDQQSVDDEQDSDICLVAKFDCIWKDYETRTDRKRQVSRLLCLDRTLSLVDQFAGYLLQQDVSEVVNDKPQSILDCLYEFMKQRYIELDVYYLSTHDLLTALIHHSSSSKLIMLMTHVIANNLDACSLRYILLLQELTQLTINIAMEDFSQFALIIYPFLNDDDLEAFQLDFISFTENNISKQLIIDYIITTILKHREPRFLEMEAVLLSQRGKDVESMNEAEFITASDDVVSVSCDRLQRRLFHQTLAYFNDSQSVPVGHLAHITSYLNLLDSSVQIKRNLKHKFAMQITAA